MDRDEEEWKRSGKDMKGGEEIMEEWEGGGRGGEQNECVRGGEKRAKHNDKRVRLAESHG